MPLFRQFWEYRVYLGYGPVLEPTLRKSLCHNHPLGGAYYKYCSFDKLDPVDGSHFGRPWYQSHGFDRVCHVSGDGNQPRLPSIRVTRLRLTFLEPQGTSLLGSTPPWKGLVYRLAPEAPVLRGMPTGPETFWGMPGVSRLRPCTRIYLKRPCATLTHLEGCATNTIDLINRLILLIWLYSICPPQYLVNSPFSCL